MTTASSSGESGVAGAANVGTNRPKSDFRALATSWAPTLVLSVLLPLFTYLVLHASGFGEVSALALAGLWPLAELVVFYVVHRRIDELSAIIVGYLVLSVLVALLFSSPRLLLIRESALTGLLGLTMIGSLVTSRPLGFYFGRKFGTDGSAAGVAWWNGLWRYPTFRRSQYVITGAWGIGLTAEAVVRIVLTFLLPVPVMSVLSFLMPLVVFPVLIAFTIVVARRTRAAAGRPGPA